METRNIYMETRKSSEQFFIVTRVAENQPLQNHYFVDFLAKSPDYGKDK